MENRRREEEGEAFLPRTVGFLESSGGPSASFMSGLLSFQSYPLLPLANGREYPGGVSMACPLHSPS